MRTMIALGWIVMAVGCGGDAPHPSLQLDVVVTPATAAWQGSVRVHAIEVTRPDACNVRPFAGPGVCDQTTDGWSCDDPMPADWLGELRVEVDGVVRATGVYDAPWSGTVQVEVDGTAGAVLVIATDDGEEVEVPLPATAPPLPSIVDVVDRDTDVEVTWTSTPPAASAVIELGGGFGGPRCHVAAPDAATLSISDTEGAAVYLQAFAAPATVTTAFGQARVWVGGTTSQEL